MKMSMIKRALYGLEGNPGNMLFAGMASRFAAPHYSEPGDESDEGGSASMMTGGSMRDLGFTVGSLEHAILSEMRLDDTEKKYALQRLQMDTGFASPDTPVTHDMLSRLGGGVLGMIVAQMLGLGGVGMGIAGMAGYGLGRTMADFYLNRGGGRGAYAER